MYLKRDKKQNNIIVFGLEEREESTSGLIQEATEIFNKDININIEDYEINTIYRIEDYTKEVLEKRKLLQTRLKEERMKGNFAYLKYDKLVVKDNNITKEKGKRKISSSPKNNTQVKKQTWPPSQGNRRNAFDVTRGRSSSLSSFYEISGGSNLLHRPTPLPSLTSPYINILCPHHPTPHSITYPIPVQKVDNVPVTPLELRVSMGRLAIRALDWSKTSKFRRRLVSAYAVCAWRCAQEEGMTRWHETITSVSHFGDVPMDRHGTQSYVIGFAVRTLLESKKTDEQDSPSYVPRIFPLPGSDVIVSASWRCHRAPSG
ncbi:hypothetical protein EVAR_78051_1 [Eumeta japonica]|uniref:Uncharacterized protein n=1 Tax=Eumeta variegata TaxID=151549 RepID=A0A4C1T182_EUMVA|nr:hypothetical protein EVAR_78051_1 [Eumeta japonica]